jgi:GT2 family glycosyltransferase
MILSIVIPTHGKRPLLERTIDALRKQEPGTDRWQIVVVNDASQDDTADFLRSVSLSEPRLDVVGLPRNVGRAAARNLGWRKAEGRWILFLDDDILAPAGLLRAHLDLLTADSANGTIGHAVTDPAIADGRHFHYIDTRGVAKLSAGPAPAKFFVTQNAAVPRDALAGIGGFDEGFAAYGFEDMDIGFRLEDAGVCFQVLPKPVPLHMHHHTLDDYILKKRICGLHSIDQIAARHPGRLREMHLDLVVDPPGIEASRSRRLLRSFLARCAGPLATRLARVWPGRGPRPWSSALFCRCMDLAVLGAYCQGLAQSRANGVKMTPLAP